jgi:hypothetical protein
LLSGTYFYILVGGRRRRFVALTLAHCSLGAQNAARIWERIVAIINEESASQVGSHHRWTHVLPVLALLFSSDPFPFPSQK